MQIGRCRSSWSGFAGRSAPARAASRISITCVAVSSRRVVVDQDRAGDRVRREPVDAQHARQLALDRVAERPLAEEDGVLQAKPAGQVRLDLPAGHQRLVAVVADDAPIVAGLGGGGDLDGSTRGRDGSVRWGVARVVITAVWRSGGHDSRHDLAERAALRAISEFSVGLRPAGDGHAGDLLGLKTRSRNRRHVGFSTLPNNSRLFSRIRPGEGNSTERSDRLIGKISRDRSGRARGGPRDSRRPPAERGEADLRKR